MNDDAQRLTAEIFETWFPEYPEIILMDFIKSNMNFLVCAVRLDEELVGISNINKDHARILLNEFKQMRSHK